MALSPWWLPACLPDSYAMVIDNGQMTDCGPGPQLVGHNDASLWPVIHQVKRSLLALIFPIHKSPKESHTAYEQFDKYSRQMYAKRSAELWALYSTEAAHIFHLERGTLPYLISFVRDILSGKCGKCGKSALISLQRDIRRLANKVLLLGQPAAANEEDDFIGGPENRKQRAAMNDEKNKKKEKMAQNGNKNGSPCCRGECK